MKEGEDRLAAMTAAFTRAGNTAAGLRIEQEESMAYAALGETEEARKLLNLAPPAPTEYQYIFALAQIGDPSAAAAMLQQQLALHPQDTLWNGAYKPVILAGLALTQGRSADALTALQSREFDASAADFHYLRGRAYHSLKRSPKRRASFDLCWRILKSNRTAMTCRWRSYNSHAHWRRRAIAPTPPWPIAAFSRSGPVQTQDKQLWCKPGVSLQRCNFLDDEKNNGRRY